MTGMIKYGKYVLVIFTLGKILEKHSFSSSDKLIWGRNISVMIFRIPTETLNLVLVLEYYQMKKYWNWLQNRWS